jgi:dolichyl-phosphate-mannose--protein O-mannosyl transferase
MILILGYLAAGLLFAAIARDNNKSRLYSTGLLFAWPAYIWMYFWFFVFYYGFKLSQTVIK